MVAPYNSSTPSSGCQYTVHILSRVSEGRLLKNQKIKKNGADNLRPFVKGIADPTVWLTT